MTPDPLYQEVVYRLHELARCASGMIPTRIPLEPLPSEITAVNDDLRIIARHVDAYLEAVGRYVSAHSPGYFDQSLFKDVLSKAIEGDATYEIEEAAEAVRERMMEAAS